MSATLSLLEPIERPSILDAERDRRRRDRPRAPDAGCEQERVRRPQIERESSDRGAQTSPLVGGAPTLDDVLIGIWDTIASDQPATCPVCHGVLEPRHGAGAAPVGARCASCGTELS